MLWLRKNILAIASIVPFGAAIYLAVIDKTASATLMAGLFVVSVVLHYFPELEVLKAFSIEARLKKRIDEAERLLDQIRSSALVSAQNTFLYLSWGQRMGTPKFEKKNDLLWTTISLLKELNVPDPEINELSKPFFHFLSFDLLLMYADMLRTTIKELSRLAREFPTASAQSDAARDRLQAQLARLTARLDNPTLKHDNADLLDITKYLDGWTPNDDLPSDTVARLQSLTAKIAELFERSLEDGRATSEMVGFMDRYVGSGKSKILYEETFRNTLP